MVALSSNSRLETYIKHKKNFASHLKTFVMNLKTSILKYIHEVRLDKYGVNISLHKIYANVHWYEKCADMRIYYVFACLPHTLQIVKEPSRKIQFDPI